MADESPYKVPLAQLLAVKVPEEEQVEETDPTPAPPPDAVQEGERRRLEVLRSAGYG